MRRVEVDSSIQYEIQVGSNRYQTVNLIADFRANDIVSWATRVWEAKQMAYTMDGDTKAYYVPPGAPTVAVKDLWINKKESQEAMTIKRIRFLLKAWCEKYIPSQATDAADYQSAVQELDDFEFREKQIDTLYGTSMFDCDEDPALSEPWGHASYDHYFPNVLAHGYVKLSNNKLDCSEELMQRNAFAQLKTEDRLVFMSEPSQRTSTPLPMATASGSTMVLSRGNTMSPAKDKHDKTQYRDAIHYRVVTQHVGERLDRVSDLNQVFAGVQDAAVGE
jgi:hypothetical protein